MRKKNLSVKVAALAMSGTLAMAPMTVRAGEVAGTTSTETTEISAAPAATPAAESSATVSGTTESGTGATTAPAAVSSDVIKNSDGSISLVEPPVNSSTTVENHVNDVVADDKQGTDIGLQVGSRKMEAKISAQDANENGQDPIGTKNPSLNRIPSIANLKNEDVVMQGDLSIAKDGSTDYDTTTTDLHEVNTEDTYSLKADLDVKAVNNAIDASAKFNSLYVLCRCRQDGNRASCKI